MHVAEHYELTFGDVSKAALNIRRRICPDSGLTVRHHAGVETAL